MGFERFVQAVNQIAHIYRFVEKADRSGFYHRGA
jgi:hypothetical protein